MIRFLSALLATMLTAPVLTAQDAWSTSRQMVLVTTASWDAPEATVSLWTRTGPDVPWEAASSVMPAVVGRNGLGWGRGLHEASATGPQKREGDGRAPAGVFRLAFAFGYEAEAPGVRMPYRQATDATRCVDDTASRWYNRWVQEDAVARDWGSHEEMRRRDELYRLGVWVEHNADPPRPGEGSCIFLHIRAGGGAPTSGCTALEPESLETIVHWLDPAALPVLVQLTTAERRRLRDSWQLP